MLSETPHVSRVMQDRWSQALLSALRARAEHTNGPMTKNACLVHLDTFKTKQGNRLAQFAQQERISQKRANINA